MSVALTSFAIFAASQVGTPGPANMALMATSARYGFRAALPFMMGVAFGKQLIIWPLGFGLMALWGQYPIVFECLKYLCAMYIIWLAWRVANLRLKDANGADKVPGFGAGLMVHPLNPKAWTMVIVGFTAFVAPETSSLVATIGIASVLLLCQLVMHPLWCLAGDQIARKVAGTPAEPYLMYTLAALTVASVLFVLFTGGA